MIGWIRTSRLSINNSLSASQAGELARVNGSKDAAESALERIRETYVQARKYIVELEQVEPHTFIYLFIHMFI